MSKQKPTHTHTACMLLLFYLCSKKIIQCLKYYWNSPDAREGPPSTQSSQSPLHGLIHIWEHATFPLVFKSFCICYSFRLESLDSNPLYLWTLLRPGPFFCNGSLLTLPGGIYHYKVVVKKPGLWSQIVWPWLWTQTLSSGKTMNKISNLSVPVFSSTKCK